MRTVAALGPRGGAALSVSPHVNVWDESLMEELANLGFQFPDLDAAPPAEVLRFHGLLPDGSEAGAGGPAAEAGGSGAADGELEEGQGEEGSGQADKEEAQAGELEAGAAAGAEGAGADDAAAAAAGLATVEAGGDDEPADVSTPLAPSPHNNAPALHFSSPFALMQSGLDDPASGRGSPDAPGASAAGGSGGGFDLQGLKDALPLPAMQLPVVPDAAGREPTFAPSQGNEVDACAAADARGEVEGAGAGTGAVADDVVDEPALPPVDPELVKLQGKKIYSYQSIYVQNTFK